MIVEQILKAKALKIRQYPVNSNRASELGHECLRYLVLNRTRWQQKTLYSAEVQMIFDMGRVIERSTEDDLREAGFSIVEQQRTFSWAKYQITGNIDLKLAVAPEFVQNDTLPADIKTKLEQFHESIIIPTEIKSAAPHPFASINSASDMLKHKYAYMRRYPAQLTLYLLMDNKEVGLFLFKNKSSGELKEIWLPLDYDFGESLIKKAEAVNKHVAEETLPDCIEYNEDICGDCGYVHICMPDRIGKEVEISDNTELLELVMRYHTLKPGAKEFDEVNDRINTLVEGREKILIGDYFISGKWVSRVTFNIPAEVKAQYKGESKSWRKDIIKV
jgi:CRISPR/Cas system-associated exonuclease Cas4 (RecB family)